MIRPTRIRTPVAPRRSCAAVAAAALLFVTWPLTCSTAAAAGEAAVIAAGSAPGESPAAPWLAAGDSAVTRIDLAGALSAFANARRADPRSYEAAWKLARGLADQATVSTQKADQVRYCTEAESLARIAVGLEPHRSEGHAFLAVALGKRALFEGGKKRVRLAFAIKSEADTAIAIDSTNDLAHHVLGVWNREIVALSGPERFFGTMLFGKLPQGSMDEAVDHLRTAVRLGPGVIPHHADLGITLAAAHRYAEAEAELEHALQMPTSWVTDDYYRAKARTALAQVRRHTGS